MAATVEIPDRPLFKASEVCAIAEVQPFVLRSWEREFPTLGESTPSGGRVYRKDDIELVLTIKRLLLVEGLTLGAARRKLGGAESPEPTARQLPLDDLLGEHARDRIVAVKVGLRAILTSLAADIAPERNGQSGTDAAASPSTARRSTAGSGKRGTSRERRPATSQ